MLLRTAPAERGKVLKTALGMIVRNVDTDEEILRFVDNAERHGHKLDCAIVAYSHNLDRRAAGKINERIPLYAIDVKNPEFCLEQSRRLGMSETSRKALLECPVDVGFGLVPYSYNRNIVLIEAMLRCMDILIFVDNDVFPAVLKETSSKDEEVNRHNEISEPVTEDVDFFGEHFKHLRAGSQITTGEYSGYNILPHAFFDGMEDLLFGLQKSEMLEYWQNSGTHRCLALKPPEHRPVPVKKILGGNTAITLSVFSKLPPFFSSHYIVDNELYLNRGEDTVLGLGIAKCGIVCTDIGIYPFHDTYKNYPAEPDLRDDTDTQNRFFYACTGWVGRNPFYNYLLGNDVKSVREFQREHLERGLSALAGYTSNPKYNDVLRNFDVSWDSLERYINEYENVLEAWGQFIKRSGY